MREILPSPVSRHNFLTYSTVVHQPIPIFALFLGCNSTWFLLYQFFFINLCFTSGSSKNSFSLFTIQGLVNTQGSRSNGYFLIHPCAYALTYFCLTSHFSDRIPQYSENESVLLHFHPSPAYTSLQMVILWPLSFLVSHKIVSFLPASDRKKCLILSYLMNELCRLFLIPIWEMFWHCILFSRNWGPFELHRDEFEDSCNSYVVLFYIYFHPFLSARLSFLALKYAFLPSLLCTLCFLMRVPHFISLQVLCSALNHDLPMCVFWGISVSNWYVWHLFNKLWK